MLYFRGRPRRLVGGRVIAAEGAGGGVADTASEIAAGTAATGTGDIVAGAAVASTAIRRRVGRRDLNSLINS